MSNKSRPWVKLWCPMVRNHNTDLYHDIINGEEKIIVLYRNPEWSRCIGPECGVWVEGEDINLLDGGKTGRKTPGRCGLAR